MAAFLSGAPVDAERRADHRTPLLHLSGRLERPITVLQYVSSPRGVSIRHEVDIAAALCVLGSLAVMRYARSSGVTVRARKAVVWAGAILVLSALTPQVIQLLEVL